MNTDTQGHLATLRALLVYRRTGLRADVHAADIAARERDDSATGEVSDLNDAAARRTSSEVQSALEKPVRSLA